MLMCDVSVFGPKKRLAFFGKKLEFVTVGVFCSFFSKWLRSQFVVFRFLLSTMARSKRFVPCWHPQTAGLAVDAAARALGWAALLYAVPGRRGSGLVSWQMDWWDLVGLRSKYIKF